MLDGSENTTTAASEQHPVEKKIPPAEALTGTAQTVDVNQVIYDDGNVRLDNDDDEVIPDDTWGNRWEFILANVGAAIGLGNFWRFPFLAFAYGGGAFFIPYIIALFTTGIPLALLEMALAQYCQQAMCRSFGSLNRRFVGLGISALWICFVIVM
ncbi:hypothetical protein SARC_10694 [Sphaeroforma arctica JP610]|uniref:Transporter n=1 Tax=Sphaeroforma arctica JP610 TaxID=667725 RepID=A0A0L0FJ67_9EUKA|nr:hypothetical protein SARC_10694 [Sphaeroforma arctica JP610]KNC76829.1 hypothetical protein SARC_10694 [Sphaeroforma arctica JP610]|eukprot:XP_014150731.1 hypothetical protein SARC_10694 [Sphaeroforma arctica JP610]